MLKRQIQRNSTLIVLNNENSEISNAAQFYPLHSSGSNLSFKCCCRYAMYCLQIYKSSSCSWKFVRNTTHISIVYQTQCLLFFSFCMCKYSLVFNALCKVFFFYFHYTRMVNFQHNLMPQLNRDHTMVRASAACGCCSFLLNY